MLLPCLFLGGALAASPAAAPKPVKAGGYPVWVNVDPALFHGQAVFDTVHLDPVGKGRTLVRLTWIEGVQPDLARTEPSELLKDLFFLDPSWTIEGDWQLARGEHPALGPTLEGSARVRIDGVPTPLVVRAIAHELAGGTGFVIALSDAPPDLEPVFAMMDVKAPRVPPSAQQTGHVELAEGYAMDLPPGWRRATPKEQAWLGGMPVNGTVTAAFVDPTHIQDVPVYSCSVTTGAATPPAVLDPAKSAVHGANFRAYARAGIVGGKVATAEGTSVLPRFLGTSVRPASLTDAAGEVSILTIGDREAYRFRTPVKGRAGELEASIFYTAWEKSALNCAILADQGDDALLAAFDAATATIRVADGADHPMELSLSERYHRWWPYSHPALQLYWLPIPLAGIALWLAMRD